MYSDTNLRVRGLKKKNRAKQKKRERKVEHKNFFFRTFFPFISSRPRIDIAQSETAHCLEVNGNIWHIMLFAKSVFFKFSSISLPLCFSRVHGGARECCTYTCTSERNREIGKRGEKMRNRKKRRKEEWREFSSSAYGLRNFPVICQLDRITVLWCLIEIELSIFS